MQASFVFLDADNKEENKLFFIFLHREVVKMLRLKIYFHINLHISIVHNI